MQATRGNLQLLPMKSDRAPVSSPTDRANIQIYRPFFISGIITVLTVGCLLGSVALLGIASQQSYIASFWTPFVTAHANSQLFGWVGFFVMGFALQQHGTTLAKRDLYHRIAYLSLGLMGAGIVLRFLAEALSRQSPITWTWLGILAGTLQAAAVISFIYNLGANRFRSKEPLTWPTGFVFASLGCFLLVSLAEPFLFIYTHQADRLASITFIAEWFTPLREVQFLGFVAMMIFGVAASKFEGCLGFQDTNAKWGISALVLWSSGLIARVSGWQIYFQSGMKPESDFLYRLGAILLAAGAFSMVKSLRLYDPIRHYTPSQKFIRGAFGWLLVSGVLLVVEPIHLGMIEAPFSHAYTGAIRHAITVGFISQMIVAVGYHLVTRMLMLDESAVPKLWSVFWLLNIGNTARVGLEIATDFSPAAFAPLGATGFVELIGLAIWGTTMIRLLTRKSKVFAKVC